MAVGRRVDAGTGRWLVVVSVAGAVRSEGEACHVLQAVQTCTPNLESKKAELCSFKYNWRTSQNEQYSNSRGIAE